LDHIAISDALVATIIKGRAIKRLPFGFSSGFALLLNVIKVASVFGCKSLIPPSNKVAVLFAVRLGILFGLFQRLQRSVVSSAPKSATFYNVFQRLQFGNENVLPDLAGDPLASNIRSFFNRSKAEIVLFHKTPSLAM